MDHESFQYMIACRNGWVEMVGSGRMGGVQWTSVGQLLRGHDA